MDRPSTAPASEGKKNHLGQTPRVLHAQASIPPRCVLILAVLAIFIRPGSTTGTVEVEFIRYEDRCSEDWGSKCDPYFRFCLGRPQTGHPSIESAKCEYGMTGSSGRYNNQNSIDFLKDGIRGLVNPWVVHVTQFYEGNSMLVTEVKDHDRFTSDDHLHTLVLWIGETVWPAEEASHWSTRIVQRGRAKLWLRLRMYCDPNYYTSSCAVYCLAQDDDLGHFDCEEGTGNKICHQGWSGPACTDDVDECDQPGVCNSGTCSNTQGSFNCSCPIGYSGDRCEVIEDPCLSAHCAHGGTCVRWWSRGTYSCTCRPGWEGRHCDVRSDPCAGDQACHNGGVCSSSDDRTSLSCVCPYPYTGPRCEGTSATSPPPTSTAAATTDTGNAAFSSVIAAATTTAAHTSSGSPIESSTSDLTPGEKSVTPSTVAAVPISGHRATSEPDPAAEITTKTFLPLVAVTGAEVNTSREVGGAGDIRGLPSGWTPGTISSLSDDRTSSTAENTTVMDSSGRPVTDNLTKSLVPSVVVTIVEGRPAGEGEPNGAGFFRESGVMPRVESSRQKTSDRSRGFRPWHAGLISGLFLLVLLAGLVYLVLSWRRKKASLDDGPPVWYGGDNPAYMGDDVLVVTSDDDEVPPGSSADRTEPVRELPPLPDVSPGPDSQTTSSGPGQADDCRGAVGGDKPQDHGETATAGCSEPEDKTSLKMADGLGKAERAHDNDYTDFRSLTTAGESVASVEEILAPGYSNISAVDDWGPGDNPYEDLDAVLRSRDRLESPKSFWARGSRLEEENPYNTVDEVQRSNPGKTTGECDGGTFAATNPMYVSLPLAKSHTCPVEYLIPPVRSRPHNSQASHS